MKGYPILRPPVLLGVKRDENVYIPMRDGVKLAVDVYRPEAEGRYPAILSLSPYEKEELLGGIVKEVTPASMFPMDTSLSTPK